jgi:hypothetical protein
VQSPPQKGGHWEVARKVEGQQLSTTTARHPSHDHEPLISQRSHRLKTVVTGWGVGPEGVADHSSKDEPPSLGIEPSMAHAASFQLGDGPRDEPYDIPAPPPQTTATGDLQDEGSMARDGSMATGVGQEQVITT